MLNPGSPPILSQCTISANLAVGSLPGAYRLPSEEPCPEDHRLLSRATTRGCYWSGEFAGVFPVMKFGWKEEEGKRKGKYATVRRCRPSEVPPRLLSCGFWYYHGMVLAEGVGEKERKKLSRDSVGRRCGAMCRPYSCFVLLLILRCPRLYGSPCGLICLWHV